MAIKLDTTFPGRVDPVSADWPLGEPRDRTAPGNGTPLAMEAYFKDFEAMRQAVLTRAGITPSDTPDTALNSQYLDGLDRLHGIRKANYAAARALDSSTLVDGQRVWIEGYPYAWEVKTGTVTDIGWHLVLDNDSNRYLESTSPVVSVDIFTGTDTEAIKSAIASGAKNIFCLARVYVVTEELELPEGVSLIGQGVGLWDSVFPSVAKSWVGTVLLFKETGAKSRSYRGITSMKESGGWREDPDNPGEYIKLTSLMNADAVGATAATPKAFSAAVVLNHHAAVRNMRIVPWFGTDGMSDYSNQSAVGLADDWDVGVLQVNANNSQIDNCQVVGHWRIAGGLDITPDFDEFGRSERGISRDSNFEGVTGYAARSGDVWNVEAATASTIDIYWTNEHYWPVSGEFRGNDSVTYSYTGLSYSAPNLQFTGVTPNPSSLFEVRNPKAGSGFAGDHAENCLFHAMDHVNGSTSDSFGLPISKCFEASGYPLRGQRYYNCKAQTGVDRCVGFFHDCEDVRWTDGQFEGSGFLVANPFESDSTANSPRGSTRNLRLLSTLISPSVDRRLFLPRSLYNDYEMFSSELDTKRGTFVRALTGKKVIIADGAGADFMTTEVTEWSPFFSFVSVPTYVEQSGEYHRIGNKISFYIYLDYSGLDTTDTSSIQIQLPVGNVVRNLSATMQCRSSTAIDTAIIGEVTCDILSSKYLIFAYNNSDSLKYNDAGVAAAGVLVVSGDYWIES